MRNKFVADGLSRFLRGKKTITSESIEKKYDAELANAVSVENGKIQERMTEEILRQEKAMNHKPSAGTLW